MVLSDGTLSGRMRRGWLRGLTFELSRPRRQGGLPVRRMMDHGRCAGKTACRSGSALERGVRPHLRYFSTRRCSAHAWINCKRRRSLVAACLALTIQWSMTFL